LGNKHAVRDIPSGMHKHTIDGVSHMLGQLVMKSQHELLGSMGFAIDVGELVSWGKGNGYFGYG